MDVNLEFLSCLNLNSNTSWYGVYVGNSAIQYRDNVGFLTLRLFGSIVHVEFPN